MVHSLTFKRGRRVLGGAARTADLLLNMTVSVVLVGRSGSVVLCTAGLEDMAVALSPGKCGSYRQILSNNSVSRWLRCRVNQTREIGPTRLSNALIMQHQFDTGYVNNNMQNKQVW